MTRRSFGKIVGAATVVGVAGYAGIYEPNHYEITSHQIGGEANNGSHALRFAQISDLHLKTVKGMHERFSSDLSGRSLDFIILTGDSIEHNDQLDILDAFMSLLPPRVTKYAILGNWEHWGNISLDRLSAIYAKWNCRLLVNESVVHRVGSESILITGLDDMVGGVPSLGLALRGQEPNKRHILLAHCPAFVDAIPSMLEGESVTSGVGPSADLHPFTFSHMFSGHTHGGQINILGLSPYLPKGSGQYIKGWYKQSNLNLYVSRGIGTTIMPVRFGSIPEVAVFDYYIS